MWQDLAYGNKARVADDAACLLADQLDLLLGQFNQQVPEELRGRLPGWLDTADYIVQDLIPFLRYCGGFEVT